MIRGQTYLKNSAKIMGGNPLLKLIAVDWFKVDKATDKIALHPKSLAQSDAGKNLPFILVINLEVCIYIKILHPLSFPFYLRIEISKPA
ncbi:protein ENHANCED DISEASE RESISTANCE 2-like isoform X1 [Gossypium hirsutum]|uniref:Protein ENHANCED DISEASE RESISTANCE 2-like isoform X1 n=1 Tax=Gossypium hirsutum TaxID=3635 RepID=A0ABM2YLP8_GOSHI|nr:protein ENHANCED DISEASE RESISTANCE 2-like isoform X1 [Gossypium hirsutum]XP_040930633.1 protein ENHANCED DISEASE RESISTANCE 2-like isoform X1 [Gossypium hirsutum]